MRNAILALALLLTTSLMWSYAVDPVPPKAVTFPDPVNTEADVTSRALPPEDAARGFRVPDGFQVNVFAAEPDIQNPIAMAWDSRGRLWVAENYTYADRNLKFDLSLRDRVLILEDTDHDGRFDKRTVFTDDVQMLASIAIGCGGVWLMTPPQLIFIPDRDGDDKPDGAPIVMLDGFTPATDNHHTFANGLKWGPDGWLYGRCGASSPGRPGPPGTPDQDRVPLFGGIWRYRPDFSLLFPKPAEQKDSTAYPSKSMKPIVEVLCHGTTNPWGHDWNENGDGFFINTVNGHLWQIIPGAHYRRPHSEDPNPHVYMTIDTHADHYHWDTGKDWTDSRKVTGEHDRLGGGHAHSGATIYLGDNWPDSYRGRLLTLNLHGRRVNVERLVPEGAGYVGQHEPDMLKSADPWFRGLDLSYGPDGAVYILDWSDTGECHEHTGVHRKSGRIFRVHYNGGQQLPASVVPGDLMSLDLNALVALHRHRNEWYVRQARRILMDRILISPEATSLQGATCAALEKLFESESDTVIKLRSLQTLFAVHGTTEKLLLELARHPESQIGAWAIRMLTDAWPLDTIMGSPHPAARFSMYSESAIKELIRSAKDDPSSPKRLALTSALQRLPVNRRLELATALAARSEDASDHNLPLMVWYGLLPVAKTDPDGLARFACNCRFPTLTRLVARRLAEMIDEQPQSIEILLTGTRPESLPDLFRGLVEGFAGRHKVKAPSSWPAIQQHLASSSDDKLKTMVRDLSVLFGDGRALEQVQRVALDGKADLAARRSALQTLIDNRAPERRKICEQLLSVRYLNTTAVRGLTEFDDPVIGDKLAKSYRSFFPSDRPAVIDALATRPSFAEALLEQVAAGKIPRGDVTVLHARQIRSFNNVKLTERLNSIWGELRDSPADKQQLITQLKSQLTAEALQRGDKSQGRATFAKACGNCHRLYGHGGQIGPDLTGSGRQNLDYVLINLVDPSAAVGADYRLSTVALNDGRVHNGIIASQTEKMVTLQTAKERLTISRTEIDEIVPSSLSLMPDGLLQPLTADQIRDLVAYLMSPTQVPLPPESP